MAEHVTLHIDGTPISVPEGVTVVDAAQTVGVEIPIFCHHPRLEPVGMCRMCLVEVGTPQRDRETGELQRDEDGSVKIRWFPQLQTGCTTRVSDGMVVRTATDEVADARRSVLEFLLTSHPLDCPVCDKGGECPLQNLTMRYGPGRSRFAWGEKFHFPKPVPVGPLIVLDRERCVLCARCIRFQDEIADDNVLGFENRGRGMEIVSFSDPPFDSYFSGNTTDICPVGALTTKDFRFEARPWEIVPKPGVCAHCPVGCNITYDTRHGAVERVMPRENDAVNEIWTCDKGRFAHHYAASPARLETPLVRRDGRLEPATWDEALGAVVDGLRAAREAHGPEALGGVAGDSVPNEGLYLFGRFLRGVLGTNSVDHRPGIVRDDVLVRAGAGAGTALVGLDAKTALLVVGLDVEEEAPVAFLNLHQAARRGSPLVVVGGRPQKLDRHADAVLRWRYGSEDGLLAALLRGVLERAATATDGRADAVGDVDAADQPDAANGPDAAASETTGGPDPGDDTAGGQGGLGAPPTSGAAASADPDAIAALRDALAPYTPQALEGQHPVRGEDLESAVAALAEADDVLVLYGRAAAERGLVPALAALVTATGHIGRAGSGLIAVGPHANSQGAADVGLLPDWLPGYRRLDNPDARAALEDLWPAAPPETQGRDAEAMLTGGVRALYVLGTDPAGDDPRYAEALDGLDFLVVQELFRTPTAERADVVLPARSAPECDGTFTSMLRRVQRFYAAVDPVGEARPDWQILRDLAQRFGASEDYDGAADVFAELAAAAPAYAGLSYAHLGPPPPPPPTSTLLPFAPQTAARYVSYEGTAYRNAFGVGAAWPYAGNGHPVGDGRPAVTAAGGELADQRAADNGQGADGDADMETDANPNGGAEASVDGDAEVPSDVDAEVAPNGEAGRSGTASQPSAVSLLPVAAGAGLDWRPRGGDGQPPELVLVPTPRLYDLGALSAPSLVLHPLIPQPTVYLSPFDATPRGLRDGMTVRLTSPHGSLEGRLETREGLTPGVVLVPEGLAWETPVRGLLAGAPTAAVEIAVVDEPEDAPGEDGS